MVGMGVSTQQIYVNVRVGSFAAYLIKAEAPVCLLFLQPVGRSPMSTWVNRVTLPVRRLLPVFPPKPTLPESLGISQRCQRTLMSLVKRRTRDLSPSYCHSGLR